ncbi:MAG: phosphoadenosine phosphosulfate reductase family protein [Thermoplasmata archaeon]|nr:phosphoadenosine phosphosulfate reductase family protein [Thermoplasmata archaeon]
MPGPDRYVLSFGAGVNTAALMVMLQRNRMPFDEAVFADTGGELPETYQFLRVARRYLKKHGKRLVVVRSRSGTLYDTCARREVTPSQVWRWSTRDYKVTPIHAYYRSLDCHIHEYLGIAYDEIHRMKASRESYITSHFPLVDQKLTRSDCVALIKSARLPVPVKSGCYFCPFNNIGRWKEIHSLHPELYTKAMQLEENSKHFPSQRLHPATLRGLLEKGFGSPETPTDVDGPCGAQCMT